MEGTEGWGEGDGATGRGVSRETHGMGGEEGGKGEGDGRHLGVAGGAFVVGGLERGPTPLLHQLLVGTHPGGTGGREGGGEETGR